MLHVQTNADLTPLNTFKVKATASRLIEIGSKEEIALIGQSPEKVLFLGAGSNMLFTRDFDGLVIKNNIRGRQILEQNEQSVTIEVGAGENWHDFVMWAAGNGYSGIENLAFIPGTVGAAPVQNLAAYGQNVGESIRSVKGYFLGSPGKEEELHSDDCRFFYRDSVFKHELKGRFLISAVVFELSKKARFDVNYHGSKPYESLQAELDKIARTPYTPLVVARAVMSQRQIKMPDWKELGTAGSFFANPFVSSARFVELQKEIPDLQAYPVDKMLYPNPDDPVLKLSGQVKIPAGKLLDVLGWRGKRIGRVGTFERHALIVVNYGGATGQEILNFTSQMQEDVEKHFGIRLVPEVNII